MIYSNMVRLQGQLVQYPTADALEGLITSKIAIDIYWATYHPIAFLLLNIRRNSE